MWICCDKKDAYVHFEKQLIALVKSMFKVTKKYMFIAGNLEKLFYN